jgi:hypothetical protein
VDLAQSITIGTDGITFHRNGHSLTGSGTSEGVHIYEKSNVKVTDLKISSFSEGISVLLSHNNIISGIQSFSIRNDGIFWETQMRT